jgi:hypothetical protein
MLGFEFLLCGLESLVKAGEAIWVGQYYFRMNVIYFVKHFFNVAFKPRLVVFTIAAMH